MRDDPTISAAAFFCEPAQMIDGHRHFTFALCQRLAVFQRNGAGDFIPAALQLGGDGQKIIAARSRRQIAPSRKCRLRIGQRLADDFAAGGAHGSDRLAIGRVEHGQRFASFAELAVEIEAVGLHLGWDIIEKRGRISIGTNIR